MWRTPKGNRVVQGTEAAILQIGLDTALELVELGLKDRHPWEFEVEQFDCLTPEQQLAMLADVGRALFYKSVPPPRHTSANEATIYAICKSISAAVAFEIDDPPGQPTKRLRKLLYRYWKQVLEPNEQLPDPDELDGWRLRPDSRNEEDWEEIIESLANKILWDRDFEMAHLFIDDAPEQAERLRRFLTIDDDYYSTIVRDPTGPELETAKRTIHRLTKMKPR